MARTNSVFSRTIAGCIAFTTAGFLVHSILSDHGGTQDSQSDWRSARERIVAVSSGRRDDALPTASSSIPLVLDKIIAGSLDSAMEPKAGAEKPAPEPTVLSLIRDNSDLSPGVSSGTDRVSVTVKAGETLFGIARRHGLTVGEIARLNAIEEPYVIKTGQTLYVAR